MILGGSFFKRIDSALVSACVIARSASRRSRETVRGQLGTLSLTALSRVDCNEVAEGKLASLMVMSSNDTSLVSLSTSVLALIETMPKIWLGSSLLVTITAERASMRSFFQLLT